jgi:hypothetical protein
MIAQINFGRKVRRHIGLWKTDAEKMEMKSSTSRKERENWGSRHLPMQNLSLSSG